MRETHTINLSITTLATQEEVEKKGERKKSLLVTNEIAIYWQKQMRNIKKYSGRGHWSMLEIMQ